MSASHSKSRNKGKRSGVNQSCAEWVMHSTFTGYREGNLSAYFGLQNHIQAIDKSVLYHSQTADVVAIHRTR